MAPLTNIGDRLTPSTPTEITFGEIASGDGRKFATLIGHRAAAGGTGTNYAAYDVIQVGDPDAAKAEVDALAGADSELGKMAEAFVKVNSTQNRSNFRPFRVVILPNAETGYGPANEALDTIKLLRSDLIVSPYEANSVPATLRTDLTDLAALLSGPDRGPNGQFGTTVVMATFESSANAIAINADNQFLTIPWLRDTALAKAQLVGVVAAAAAGLMLQLVFPYEGLDDEILGGILAPSQKSDYIQKGATELSEAGLQAGLAPLYVDPAGRVRMVRSRLSIVTRNTIPVGSNYIDWQDYQVLYDFREDAYNMENGSQFKNKKANVNRARLLRDELVRLMDQYEVAEAFQNVKQLAKLLRLERNANDRSRFDYKLPVNVVPILHVIAGNIQATTLFDEFTI